MLWLLKRVNISIRSQANLRANHKVGSDQTDWGLVYTVAGIMGPWSSCDGHCHPWIVNVVSCSQNVLSRPNIYILADAFTR